MSAVLTATVALPADYRRQDILAFHRRDASETAECANADGLQKAIVWQGRPACLAVRFAADRAEAELVVDGGVPAGGEAAFAAMLGRLLGLTQNVEGFERRYREHPQLGALIAGQRGLRVAVAATPFEALTWAVTGQQISLGAAVSLRRRLIVAAGIRHSGGLYCYPDAARLAELPEEVLRAAGFSTAKARTVRELAERVARRELPLDDWTSELPVDEVRARLLAVRGIGPWTTDYTLLRGFGWLDGSLHGDVAVRRKLQLLLAAPEKLTPERTAAWLAAFSPWRALVAAHLWAARLDAAAR